MRTNSLSLYLFRSLSFLLCSLSLSRTLTVPAAHYLARVCPWRETNRHTQQRPRPHRRYSLTRHSQILNPLSLTLPLSLLSFFCPTHINMHCTCAVSLHHPLSLSFFFFFSSYSFSHIIHLPSSNSAV